MGLVSKIFSDKAFPSEGYPIFADADIDIPKDLKYVGYLIRKAPRHIR